MENEITTFYLYLDKDFFLKHTFEKGIFKFTNLNLYEFPKNFEENRKIYRDWLKIKNEIATKGIQAVDYLSSINFYNENYDMIKEVELYQNKSMINEKQANPKKPKNITGRILSIEFDKSDSECYVIYPCNLMKYINSYIDTEAITLLALRKVNTELLSKELRNKKEQINEE